MIKVVASDNPHGVFSLSQPVYDSLEGDGANSVTSLTDFTSYVSVSVVRSKGTMGRVRCILQDNQFLFSLSPRQILISTITYNVIFFPLFKQ